MREINTPKELVLILPDIRSTQNVGSLFRTSDTAGISKLYLAGHTPTPIDRFGRDRSDITKTALGAEKSIPWEYISDIQLLIRNLKEEGFYIIAIEQSNDSVDYKSISIEDKEKVAFILGNEVSGIPNEILHSVDVIAEIPQRGAKESLNISVAFGIAVFRILNI